ncbi:hypothetical protein ACIBCL_17875 [Micromonospora zamorensis]|uniref:hypothetical protein n=1 Tax=Micromonospora zamorensis TaxID=709883 RepID=UPI0037B2BEE3
MTADADQFRQSMDDALDTLRELRANRPSAEELVRIRGEATAADGLIAVVASPGGRVESITVAPQVLRNALKRAGLVDKKGRPTAPPKDEA